MKVKSSKFIQKVILFTILFTFCFSTSGYHILADRVGFSDVKDSYWGKAAIDRLSSYGIINGYPDGTYKPDNEIRTNEFTALIVRIFHMNWNIIQELSLDDSTDAKGKNWEQNSIDFAKRTGLIKENEFEDYSQPITRAQMARIVSRAICIMENPSYSAVQVPNFSYDITPYSQFIKDFDELGEYKDFVLAMYAKGIINGYSDGEFKPDRTVTRAEATAIIDRIFRKEDRTNIEMQRYIKTYPSKQRVQWQDGATSFVINYHSSGTMLPIETTIKISREEGLQYKEYDFYEKKTLEEFSRKLSETELKEIFEYIINDNYFFVLPSNLSTDDLVTDGYYSSLKVTLNGKEHGTGGYVPENKYYSDIVDKVFELKEKLSIN